MLIVKKLIISENDNATMDLVTHWRGYALFLCQWLLFYTESDVGIFSLWAPHLTLAERLYTSWLVWGKAWVQSSGSHLPCGPWGPGSPIPGWENEELQPTFEIHKCICKKKSSAWDKQCLSLRDGLFPCPFFVFIVSHLYICLKWYATDLKCIPYRVPLNPLLMETVRHNWDTA